MSDIINILPDSVANQIAAGEVVDRPASAVKELLENAIDAGATQIQLIVKDAGRTLLQVIDNGSGMSDSDARLCFERHATSKVHRADDLFNLHTMGFRGEALASIAAIAQVDLKTRLRDAEIGTSVVIEGSEVKSQTQEACPEGTSIAVKNLFFNVPARRNFLKKDSVELSHIEEVFRRITLPNCHISFTFHHNGKLLYDLRAGNLMQRICQLFGTNYNERFFRVEEKNEIVSVDGYVGKPEYGRKTRGEQYIFVNHRFIKHPALSAAIEKAYTDLIPDRYYPSYFLNLTVDPSRIDVNIHPTKTEVKFIDEHAIFVLLRAAAKRSLGQFGQAGELEFNPSTELSFDPAPKGYIPPEPQISYNPDYNPFNSTSSSSSSHSSSSSLSSRIASHRSNIFFDDEPRTNRWENFFGNDDNDTISAVPSDTISETPDSAAESSPVISSTVGGTCFQVLSRWIVSSMPSGLLVVDQHRAHQRIIYERFLNSQSPIGSQQLLFPVSCTFSPADAEVLNELLPDISQRGFELSPLGKNTFVVTGAPAGFKDSQLQQLMEQLIADYKSSMLLRGSQRDKSIALTLSHQMALSAGQPLQHDEMQQLLSDLFSCQVPQLSPDGEKTMVILNADQLNRLF